jgi:hypothetical protein
VRELRGIELREAGVSYGIQRSSDAASPQPVAGYNSLRAVLFWCPEPESNRHALLQEAADFLTHHGFRRRMAFTRLGSGARLDHGGLATAEGLHRPLSTPS